MIKEIYCYQGKEERERIPRHSFIIGRGLLPFRRKSNGSCWNINTFNRVTGGGKLGRLAYMTSSTKPAQTSLWRVHSLVNQSEQSTLSTRMSSEIWPSQKLEFSYLFKTRISVSLIDKRKKKKSVWGNED